MNATKQKFKGRNLHKEDCLQMVAAERREYVEVPASVRIAENNDIVADLAGQLPQGNMESRINAALHILTTKK